MKELTIDATIENIAAVTAFIDEQLEQRDCRQAAPFRTVRYVHLLLPSRHLYTKGSWWRFL